MDFEKEFIADITRGVLDVFKLLAAMVIFFFLAAWAIL